MSSSFCPIDEFEVYCRFCEKISRAQLDRSIAENGKLVDRNSIFEYYCTKCLKTFCFNGTDLLEQSLPESSIRIYSPREHYFIGETIFHNQFTENGIIINKDNGKHSKILVHFPKNGLRKLIQDM
jgi:hypothetical protein